MVTGLASLSLAGTPREAAALSAYTDPNSTSNPLYESPRAMRHRMLRSAPVNLGFSHPTNTGSRFYGGEDEIYRLESAHRLSAHYPLSHAVMHAQYSQGGTFHCL